MNNKNRGDDYLKAFKDDKMSPRQKVEQLRSLRSKADEFTVYVNTVSLDLYLLEGLEEAISKDITLIIETSDHPDAEECITFMELPPFVTLAEALKERNPRFLEDKNCACIASYINDAVLNNIDTFRDVKSVEEHFFI